MKQQGAKGLLSNLGIKTPLSEIPFFYSNIYTTFKRKNLQSPGNLNLYIIWEKLKVD